MRQNISAPPVRDFGHRVDHTQLGSFGKQPGRFHFCHQIAAAPDGSVYTAEILNWRPQKFVLK